jgi:hypothetical protein
MNNRIIPFIREESGRGVTTIAIVRLGTSHKVSSLTAIKNLCDAVTEWVMYTTDGKQCWKESDKDLNIGDLAMYEMQFKAWVQTKAWVQKKPLDIQLKDFEILYLGEASEGSVEFDRHLANKDQINRRKS